MRGGDRQGNPPTDGVAHENALANANSIKKLHHERDIVLHRPDTRWWLALLPSGQLGRVGEGDGAQCHVIRLPPAGASHAVQIQHRLRVSRLATSEVRDVKTTDLYPVPRKNCAVRCSH